MTDTEKIAPPTELQDTHFSKGKIEGNFVFQNDDELQDSPQPLGAKGNRFSVEHGNAPLPCNTEDGHIGQWIGRRISNSEIEGSNPSAPTIASAIATALQAKNAEIERLTRQIGNQVDIIQALKGETIPQLRAQAEKMYRILRVVRDIAASNHGVMPIVADFDEVLSDYQRSKQA